MKDDLSPAAKHVRRVFLKAVHDGRDLKVEDLEPPSPGVRHIGRMFLEIWHAEDSRFRAAQEAAEPKSNVINLSEARRDNGETPRSPF